MLPTTGETLRRDPATAYPRSAAGGEFIGLEHAARAHAPAIVARPSWHAKVGHGVVWL
jgi:hypothetical protein